MDPEALKAIIEDDEFGLLDVPEKAPPLTGEERLADGFQEIVDFVKRHGREPEADLTNMAEAKLAWRLNGIRSDAAQIEQLSGIDELGLLADSSEPPESLDEIFESDDLGLLGDSEASSILDTSALPEAHASPEDVAETRPAEDFARFEPIFQEVQAELRAGARKLVVAAKEENIREGAFFVVRGVLCYIDDVEDPKRSNYGRTAERVRVVYENGTESNPQRRSFQRALHRYGKAVTEPSDSALERLDFDAGVGVGYVYVLRSLSDDPQVTSIPFLHKIGFTRRSVSERLEKAEDAITFLKAPVEVVAEYELPAPAAQKVEQMLHRLFAEVRVDASFVQNGVPVGEATEWFSVPRGVVDQAIEMIESGAITNYVYDREKSELVLR